MGNFPGAATTGRNINSSTANILQWMSKWLVPHTHKSVHLIRIIILIRRRARGA